MAVLMTAPAPGKAPRHGTAVRPRACDAARAAGRPRWWKSRTGRRQDDRVAVGEDGVQRRPRAAAEQLGTHAEFGEQVRHRRIRDRPVAVPGERDPRAVERLGAEWLVPAGGGDAPLTTNPGPPPPPQARRAGEGGTARPAHPAGL